MQAPGHPESAAVIRRLKLHGVERFRLLTGAPTSTGRLLVGYYPTGDDAATAAWPKYVDDTNSQHELASRTHGGKERGGPTTA